jgi:hypothetical protein
MIQLVLHQVLAGMALSESGLGTRPASSWSSLAPEDQARLRFVVPRRVGALLEALRRSEQRRSSICGAQPVRAPPRASQSARRPDATAEVDQAGDDDRMRRREELLRERRACAEQRGGD